MSRSRRVHVKLDAPGAAFRVRLFDHLDELVDESSGKLETDVPEGLYRIVVDAGSSAHEEIVRVGPGGLDRTFDQNTIPAPAIGPAEHTSTLHEFHGYPIERLSATPQAGYGTGGRLVVAVRTIDGDQTLPADASAIEVLDASGQTLTTGPGEFAEHGGLGLSAVSLDVAPGGYLLRESDQVDQSIHVCDGWITLVFIGYYAGCGLARPEFATVHMAPLETGYRVYGSEVNLALEMAYSGLRQGRAILPDKLAERLVNGDYRDPMIGIVGALNLLLQPEVPWSTFAAIRRKVAAMIPDHPDARALWLIQKDATGNTDSTRFPRMAWPPMFAASYAALVRRDISEQQGRIVPGSLAEMVAARQIISEPWLRWIADDAAAQPSPAASRGAAHAGPGPEAQRIGAFFAFQKRIGRDVAELSLDDIATATALPKEAAARGLEELRATVHP